MNVQLLDKAVAGALCPTFQGLVAGGTAVNVLGPFLGPKGMAAAVAAVPVTSLSMLGASATCGEVEIGPETYPGLEGGCTKTDKGTLLNATKTDGSNSSQTIDTLATEIRAIELGTDEFGFPNWKVTYLVESGETRTGWGLRGPQGGGPAPQRIELIPRYGAVCLDNAPIRPPFENPTIPDHVYTDPDTNCVYNVSFRAYFARPIKGRSCPSTKYPADQRERMVAVWVAAISIL